MRFSFNLVLLIEPFCYTTKKLREKDKYLENEKSFRGETKKLFLSFLKGFQLVKITLDLRVHL